MGHGEGAAQARSRQVIGRVCGHLRRTFHARRPHIVLEVVAPHARSFPGTPCDAQNRTSQGRDRRAGPGHLGREGSPGSRSLRRTAVRGPFGSRAAQAHADEAAAAVERLSHRRPCVEKTRKGPGYAFAHAAVSAL